jgi:hypothetical protein
VASKGREDAAGDEAEEAGADECEREGSRHADNGTGEVEALIRQSPLPSTCPANTGKTYSGLRWQQQYQVALDGELPKMRIDRIPLKSGIDYGFNIFSH